MMQNEALEITKMACLSRSVIGTVTIGSVQKGNEVELPEKGEDHPEAMIVTLPGKPKAAKENFEILM